MVWEYIIGGTLGSVIIGVAIYPAFKLMPFVYGASRVRAARSKLFSQSELNDFANESYKDVIYHLEKKGVSELVGLIDEGFREDLVQSTLRKSYYDDINRVLKYVPRDYRKFFKLMQLKDTFDFIIAVIRSKTSPYHERHVIGELFFETENFSESESIEKISLEDFLRMLRGTPYYEYISPFEEEIKAGTLVNFEKSFNVNFFRKFRHAAGNDETLKGFVRRFVDISNVRGALSFGGEAITIPHGSLKDHTVDELKNAKGVSGIVKALNNTYLAEFVTNCETVIDLENALMKVMKEYASKLIKEEPLTIKPMLSYYIHKRVEFRNIRIILKLIKANFEPEEIRGVLV